MTRHVLIIMGAPGSGKGTQSKKLVTLLGIPQISMGDILRQKRTEESVLGNQLNDIMNSGALVPDSVVIEIIRDRLATGGDTEFGFILDGFPRTVAQADALDQVLDELGQTVTAALFIDVPVEQLVPRLTGRRVCAVCGHEHHVTFAPPARSGVCDACGGELVQRPDDTIETITARQKVFREQTAPLVDYYDNKQVLRRIQGVDSPDAVFGAIKKAVGITAEVTK